MVKDGLCSSVAILRLIISTEVVPKATFDPSGEIEAQLIGECVEKTKKMPHMEKPEEFINQIRILLSDEE